MSAPKLPKDFVKESKDLMTKNVQAAGAWKFESKLKAGNETFSVVPKSEVKGEKTAVSAKVEYNSKQYGVKTEATVDAAGNVAPKVTYEFSGKKVEVSAPKLEANPAVSVTFEGAFAGANTQAVLTQKKASGMLSYAVPGLTWVTVGASGAFVFDSKQVKDWTVGFRAALPCGCGTTVAGQTTEFKKFTATAMAPVTVAGQKLKLAVMADGTKDKLAFDAGCEFKCPMGLFDSVRVLVGKKDQIAATFVAAKKLANGWTATVSLSTANFKKVGLLLTQE